MPEPLPMVPAAGSAHLLPWGDLRAYWIAAGIAVAPREAFIPLYALRHRCLTPAESALLESLSTVRRQRAFFAGRLLAKQCIGAVWGVSAGDVEVRRSASGLPSAAISGVRLPARAFSISHGGDFIMAGAVRRGCVGVDVEPISDRPRTLRERFLDETEVVSVDRAVRAGAFEASVLHTLVFSAKETLAKCFDSHLFHAFHYFRFVEADASTITFRSSGSGGLARASWRQTGSHVLTWLTVEKEPS